MDTGAEHSTPNLPDPADAPFLECARAAGVPLVTGNLRHYPRAAAPEVAVITPAQYVAALGRVARGEA